MRDRARDRRQARARRGVDARDRAQQRLRVRVLRARGRCRRPALARPPGRGTSPTTSSAISATTPRLWVISMIAMPVAPLQLAQQLEDLRLGRHVERGGRLVGDQELGSHDERHRDHRALAQPAAQLEGVLVHALLRRAGCRPGGASRSLARAPPSCRAPGAAGSPRSIWLPIVWTGLNEVIGSWKISAISPPRICAHLPALRGRGGPGRSSRPSPSRSEDLPADDPARPLDDPQDRARGDALAAAALADDAQRLARVDVEAHAVDGLTVPSSGKK